MNVKVQLSRMPRSATFMVGEAQQQQNKQKLDIEQEIRASLAPARADVGLR